jgi:hypothetical protein
MFEHPRSWKQKALKGRCEKLCGGDTLMQQTDSKEAQKVYERFLELPVGIVLATLWLSGTALLGLCGLMVYELVRLVVGA